MRVFRLLAFATVVAAAPAAAEPTASSMPPTIAIIIDDMGHNLHEGRRLANMDQPLTLAFLPYRPHTDSLARLAHRKHKEIMLHAPMANTHNFGLGQGGLTPEMDQRAMTTTLRTQQLQPMDWVMRELQRYPVYFVDSRTIASSVAGDVAQAYQIPTLTRDVFLDHEQTEAFIDRQFKLLIKRARENGSAVGIGHPHPVTVDYLEKHLPMLDEQGIAIATISGLWAIRNDNREMFAEGEKQAIRPAVANKD